MTTNGCLETYHRHADLIYTIREPLLRCDSYEEVIYELDKLGVTFDHIRETLSPIEADLHLHSTFSDGVLQPKRIVWFAKLIGMQAVAITDHDTIGGVDETVQEGSKVGLQTVIGLELNAGRPGLEILAYFPKTRLALNYFHSDASQDFRDYLAAIMQDTHERTISAIPAVNDFLHGQGFGPEHDITVEEISVWYSGQEPFYPGTLAVLALKRLAPEQRKQLDLFDPRVVNTRVITPIMKQLPPSKLKLSIEGVVEQIANLRSHAIEVVPVLAHPIELTTKGQLGYEDAETLIRQLFAERIIDGIEVNNSRDTAETTARWIALARDLASSDWPCHAFSFSSDFHVLAPGFATGEITPGYGYLDERPGHCSGNLMPLGTFAQLAAAIGFEPA